MYRCRMICLLFVVTAFISFAAEKPISEDEKEAVLADIGKRMKPVMGEKWADLYETFKPRFQAAKTEKEFYDTVDAMFEATGQSHFMMMPPDQARIAKDEEKGDDSGDTGIRVRLIDGVFVVVRVRDGSPAARAGIKPGFVIDTINGYAVKRFTQSPSLTRMSPHRQQVAAIFRSHRWLSGPPGAERVLGIRDLEGKERTITLTLEKLGKIGKWGHLPPVAMRIETRKLADGKVGYIAFNIFLMPLLMPIKNAIKEFKDCDGIILDIRGNPGGLGMMAIPIAAQFLDKRVSLGETKSADDILRYPVFPVRKPYRGKLIVLTDEMTASTSEILAAGLQEHGRAEVVGHRSMGAVLPSLIIQLPNGAQVQYPIGDFKTAKGVELEGEGVKPDHTVKITREILKDDPDPVLSKAVELIIQ